MKKNVVKVMSLVAAMVLWMLIPVTAHAEASKELYCLFNPVSGEYLYTVDENEKAALEGAWHLEGVVCKMPTVSSTATYRLYNPTSGLHLYTADNGEITKLTGEGWTKEGVAYYVDDNKTAPVYRLFDPKTGEHAFGSDATAAKMEQNGWTREGVAFYATWANSELTYTGKKTAAGTTVTTTTVTTTNGINAPGKWYNGLQRKVWYDAGDHFFYICEVDSYEANKATCFTPEVEVYQDMLMARYPGTGAGPQFLEAKQAGGVPVVVVDDAILVNGVLNYTSDYVWNKGSKSLANIKADQTFAPIGTDSPWGELYVVHGNGLEAYYYAVDNHNRVENDELHWDNDYYHLRENAASMYLNRNLEEAYGGFLNAHAVFGDHWPAFWPETVGTWNGFSIVRVFWNLNWNM